MKIVLLRHGLAEEKLGVPDAERSLVEKGIKKTELVCEKLIKLNLQFDLIVTSPLVRAKETAKIAQRIFKVSTVLETPTLQHGVPSVEFYNWLRTHADEAEAVLVVGHEPHLSSFASWCLSFSEHSFIELKKSGSIGLEILDLAAIQQSKAKLLWVIRPKFFE